MHGLAAKPEHSKIFRLERPAGTKQAFWVFRSNRTENRYKRFRTGHRGAAHSDGGAEIRIPRPPLWGHLGSSTPWWDARDARQRVGSPNAGRTKRSTSPSPAISAPQRWRNRFPKHVHMPADELPPARRLTPLRSRYNVVAAQNLREPRDSVARNVHRRRSSIRSVCHHRGEFPEPPCV